MDIYNKNDSKDWLEPIVVFTALAVFLIIFLLVFPKKGDFGGVIAISASVIIKLTNYLMIRSNE